MRKVQVQNILTEKETQLNSLVKELTDAVFDHKHYQSFGNCQ